MASIKKEDKHKKEDKYKRADRANHHHSVSSKDELVLKSQKLISWYFEYYCTDKKPNSHRANYVPLCELINEKIGKEDIMTASFLKGVVHIETDRKSKILIEYINKSILDFAEEKDKKDEVGRLLFAVTGTSENESRNSKIIIQPHNIEQTGKEPYNNSIQAIKDEFGGTEQLIPLMKECLYQFRFHQKDSVKKIANAVRIVGAHNECFFENNLAIEWTSRPYELPQEMKKYELAVIAKHEAARKAGELYFNGMNARLCNFYFHKADLTEQKSITLELGPVRWNDYLIANRDFSKRCDELLHENASLYVDELSKYVDLQLLIKDRRIKSYLSNICETVTTIITRDGYVLFSMRGLNTAVPNLYTSAVAENVHPILDSLTDGLDLNIDFEKDLGVSSQSLIDKEITKSKWPNMNSAFYAVIRGFHEELSPKILDGISPEDMVKYIRCLGISFDLNSLHPDLLFIAILPLNFTEIKENISKEPGPDFREGRIDGRLLSDTNGLDEILSKPNWTGGGKASLLRSLEYLKSLDLLTEFDFNRAIFNQ